MLSRANAHDFGSGMLIAVIGKSGKESSQSGPFTLAWYPTSPPGFTGTQFSPLGGAPGTKVTLTGTNFTGATAVLFNGASASFTNALTNNLDLRITAVMPPDAASGPITVVTPHGNVTSTASFQVLPPPLSITSSLASGLEISWPATSDALVLEVSEDLNKGPWSPVTAPLVVTNGVTKFTLTAATESVRVEAGDPEGLQRLLEYFLRCPFSQARMIEVTEQGKVIYKTGDNRLGRFPEAASEDLQAGPKRNFQVFDPLDFLAEVTQHIPDPGEHLIRYYGFYSNKSRGLRAKGPAQAAPAAVQNSVVTPSAKEARKRWAALIKQVYEIDPLLCPKCGAEMKVIAFIERRQRDVIEKILRHCGLWEQARPGPPFGPGAGDGMREVEGDQNRGARNGF